LWWEFLDVCGSFIFHLEDGVTPLMTPFQLPHFMVSELQDEKQRRKMIKLTK
jgi:hypothetical protein